MINLITIGSCTPLEIMQTDSNFFSKYNLLYKYTGSISRTYYPPGKIALNIMKDKNLYATKNVLLKQQIDAITKEQDLLSIIRSSPKNTVIIIDLSYELWRFYYDGIEMFDVCSFYPRIENSIPTWLKDTISKNKKNFDNENLSIARRQYEYIEDFITQLSQISNNVILFGNTFTSNMYCNNTNQVGTFLPVHRIYNAKIPIGKNYKFSSEIMAYQYIVKVIQNFYNNLNKFVSKISNLTSFHIDLNKVYSDPYHHQGPHPSHYHRSCREFLQPLLETTINDVLQKNKNSELILLNH